MSRRDENDRVSSGISVIFLINLFVLIVLAFLINSSGKPNNSLSYLIKELLLYSMKRCQLNNISAAWGYFTTMFVYGSVSIVQLVYVIPAVFWLGRQQKWSLMKGVIIGAVLTALLTSPCFPWCIF